MSRFDAYLKFLRAWMAGSKTLHVGQAVAFAVETLARIAHIDVSTPFGALVVALIEGFILDGSHYDEIAGPVMKPEHAVVLAIESAKAHELPVYEGKDH